MTKRSIKTWTAFTGSYFYDEHAVRARSRKEACRKLAKKMRANGVILSAGEVNFLTDFWVRDPKGTNRQVYTSYPHHLQ